MRLFHISNAHQFDMIRRKIIIGTTTTVGAIAILVALLIASPPMNAAAAPSYTTVTDKSVTANSAGTVYKFSVTTAGKIPRTADSYIKSVLVFGYAWLDNSASPKIVAATIH